MQASLPPARPASSPRYRYRISPAEAAFGIPHILERTVVAAAQDDIFALARVNKAAFPACFELLRLYHTVTYTPRLLPDVDGPLQEQPLPFPFNPDPLLPLSRETALKSIKHVKINATPLLHFNCLEMDRLKRYEHPEWFALLNIESLTIKLCDLDDAARCLCAKVFRPRVLIIEQSHDTALLWSDPVAGLYPCIAITHVLVDASTVNRDIPLPGPPTRGDIYIHFALWKETIPFDRVVRLLLGAFHRHRWASFIVVGTDTLSLANTPIDADKDSIEKAVCKALGVDQNTPLLAWQGHQLNRFKRKIISKDTFLQTEQSKHTVVAGWYATRKKDKH